MNDFGDESCHFLRIVLMPLAQGMAHRGAPGARGRRGGMPWVQGGAEIGWPGRKEVRKGELRAQGGAEMGWPGRTEKLSMQYFDLHMILRS